MTLLISSPPLSRGPQEKKEDRRSGTWVGCDRMVGCDTAYLGKTADFSCMTLLSNVCSIRVQQRAHAHTRTCTHTHVQRHADPPARVRVLHDWVRMLQVTRVTRVRVCSRFMGTGARAPTAKGVNVNHTSRGAREDGFTSYCHDRLHQRCADGGALTRNNKRCVCACHTTQDRAPIGDVRALLGERGDVLKGRYSYAYAQRCGEYHVCKNTRKIQILALMRDPIGRARNVANVPWRVVGCANDPQAKLPTMTLEPAHARALVRAAKVYGIVAAHAMPTYPVYPCM